MAYKSGHIYIVDHEPTDEEVAGFAKPVEFYVGSNGKYYSILFDKNGNKYVQDASKVVTGFIKIGEISQIGRIITIGVHPSGFNHWRINGVDVTTENPSILEIEPVSDGKFRVDYIVGNSGGGLFILPGEESKYPIEINPLDYPSFAFFQRVLVTPDGLGGGTGGSSQNTTYQTIQSGSLTNFSIDYDGVMTRFRIVTNIDVPKTLLSINFNEETDKAVEFLIFNDTNLNINVPASASLGLSKGFSLNTPFAILPKSYALLKYNPDADSLEFWKVNSSGFALPITGNTGDVLEKDPTAVSGAKWTDRFSGLTANLLSFWNGSKFINSIISQVAGKIGIGTASPAETLDVSGRVKANSLVLGANVGTPVPWELGRKDGVPGYADASGAWKGFSSQVFEHQVRGKVLTENAIGTYNCDLNSYTRWVLTLDGNASIVFTNMIAEDETITLTMNVTGNFTLTFPSWLKQSPDSYIYDGNKINRITIEIGRGGTSPSGRYIIEKYDS